MGQGNGNGALLNVPITFNGVSVGKEKVSVGIGIDHSRVTREQMGELFVGRQLDIDLATGEPDAQPLPSMESDDVRIKGTVTVTGYSEKEASFGTRLTMPKKEARPADFWNLAGRSGWLKVKAAQDAEATPHKPLDGQGGLPHPDVEAGKDKPHTGSVMAQVAEVRARPIPQGKDGLTKPQAQLLASAGITTLGGLSDLVAKGAERAADILGGDVVTAEGIITRAQGFLGSAASAPEPKQPPKSIREMVPNMDAAELIDVPMDGTNHSAQITIAPLKGSWWAGGWSWTGDGGWEDHAADAEPAIIRQSKDQTLAAAASALVGSIDKAEKPKTAAGQKRRSKAIDACKTFYSEAERGGATIFDTLAAAAPVG